MTKLSIEDIYVPTNDEWDLIWRECDYATYFHSREWAEIWNVYTKGQTYPSPKLILFSDGKKAFIPLSVESGFKGLVKTYISSPAGTFGGWIATDKLKTAHANLIVNHLLKECPNLLLFMNPYDELVFKSQIAPNIQDETYVINLSSGFEVAYKKWKKSQKYKVNHASKLGVLIRHGNTFEDWNLYYEVYEDTLRRWGKKATSNHSKGLFEELFNRQSPHIKLRLATYENKVVAGNIIFYSKKHVVGWHAAALEKYFKTGMVNLLIYDALKDACEDGYSWFDFNTCGGHESVRAFKKGFGTKELSSPVINIETSYKKIFNKSLGLARKMGIAKK